VRNQVGNLTAVQLKLGHSPVRTHDSLGERLREILNRIAEVERPEWRLAVQSAAGFLQRPIAKGPGERASA
jgi:hypothetical protein